MSDNGFNLIGERFGMYHAYKYSEDDEEALTACTGAYHLDDMRNDDCVKHVTCEECRAVLGLGKLDTVRTHGFEIRMEKPIDAFSDDELDKLESDHDMLMNETDRLGTLITGERKRRNDRGEE